MSNIPVQQTYSNWEAAEAKRLQSENAALRARVGELEGTMRQITNRFMFLSPGEPQHVKMKAYAGIEKMARDAVLSNPTAHSSTVEP